MRVAALLALLILMAGSATALHGQQAQVVCDIQARPGGDLQTADRGLPTERAIVTRARFICDGGRRIFDAETATYSAASGMIEFFDDVRIQEAERTLTAPRVTYITRMRQMDASGGVVVTDRNTGSVIRGDLLNYLEATAQRESQMTVTGTTRLAQAMLVSERAAEPAVRDTVVVDAMQIYLAGEDVFRGIGNAVLTRDSLRATGHLVEYAQAGGRLDIVGGGRVELPGYQLQGDSITAVLGEDDEIREVLTRHGSSLQSDDMRVTAAAVRLFFENGGVIRLVAMDWEPAANAVRGGRARAEAEQFRMEADSLDVLAPDRQLREAVAIGGAHVERITPDSLRALLPEVEPAIHALIADDWMRGDTVRAHFGGRPVPAADAVAAGSPADAGAEERVLERLAAVGEPAQAMHRLRDENGPPDAKLSIAYLVGRQVEVWFVDGVVSVVTASDDVRGVYLQPSEAARRTAAGGGGPNDAALPPRQQQ
jgi:lipopolysaccharide export system protein LptA